MHELNYCDTGQSTVTYMCSSAKCLHMGDYDNHQLHEAVVQFRYLHMQVFHNFIPHVDKLLAADFK